MKPAIRYSIPMCIGTILCAFASAHGQSGGGYTIVKSTIDSGGGTVAGGDYRLTGTTGQPDAGPVSGGDYSLIGGFWSPASSAPVVPTASDPDKTRFISFTITGGTGETALRVKLTSLHHVVPPYTGGTSVAFTEFEGQELWVGPPAQFMESSGSGTPFYSSTLQCTPHYQDWNTIGLLHVTGSAVTPSSIYHVENMDAVCQGNEGTAACSSGGINVSHQLEIRTTRWGDVEVPYNPPDATVQPNISDITAMVRKFGSLPGAPIKARVTIAGNDANGNFAVQTLSNDFNFSHIAACVSAFRGEPYPFKMGKCATGPGVCTTDAECSGASAPPCNLYCP